MPKNRTYLLLILALLLTGAVCLLLWLLPEKESADSSEETPSVQFLFDYNDPNCVSALSFSYSDYPPISLEYVNNSWQIIGRTNLPIEQNAVKALIDKLEYMLSLRIIAENLESVSEYGLDAPFCTVTVVTDGEEKSYLFGSRNDYYEGYYCMIRGDHAVYMTDESYVGQFNLTLEDLLGSDNLPDLSNLLKATWQASNGTEISAVPEGENAELLDLLSSIELGKWIDYGSEQYAIYGLDTPAIAQLTLWDGASLTLSFGEGETEDYIYIRAGDSEMIYLVECSDSSLLLNYIKGN